MSYGRVQSAYIESLEKRLAKAEADTARLDFIESRCIDTVVGQESDDSPRDWGCYFVLSDDPTLRDFMEVYRTPREAIDAAMKFYQQLNTKPESGQVT